MTGHKIGFFSSNIENYPLIVPFTPSYLEHCKNIENIWFDDISS